MTRLTVQMDEQFANTLARLAEGVVPAKVIERAVATYSYFKTEVPNGNSGKQISIRNADGSILKDVVLP